MSRVAPGNAALGAAAGFFWSWLWSGMFGLEEIQGWQNL